MPIFLPYRAEIVKNQSKVISPKHIALNLEKKSLALSLGLWAKFQPMTTFVVVLDVPGK